MNARTIAATFAISALLPAVSLAAITAPDSSGTVPSLTSLPCQSEMTALMSKSMPTITSAASMSAPQGPVTPGSTDVNSLMAGMNTPEGKALQNCLAANMPSASSLATNAPGAPAAPSTLTGTQASPGTKPDMQGSANITTATAGSCPVITRTLARGSRGADVSTLQNYFVSLNLLSSDSATGYFGNLSVAATKSWQSSHGLDPVGFVGPKTRAALAKCGQ